jgi:hypothetical protein
MGQADRSNFESEWEQAFSEARVTPPEGVWAGIEQQLNSTPATGKGKRIFLIQLAMAASVLFAMSIGAAGVFELFQAQKLGSENVTQDINNSMTPGKKSVPGYTRSDQPLVQSGADSRITSEAASKIVPFGVDGDHSEKSEEPVTALANSMPFDKMLRSLSSFFSDSPDKIESRMADLSYDARLAEVKPEGVPNYIISPSKKHETKGWASLGFSAGSLSSGSGSQNSYVLSQTGSSTASLGRVSQESGGSMYQVEMNFGKKIARRWILQGGIGYMQRNTEGSSNLISARGDAMADFSSTMKESNFSVGQPYALENTMEIVTLPVQVGYVVLDKKVGVRVLTGVASELMLKYQIEDSEGNLGSQTFRPGDNSDYNTYGMSALVTTEISYAIADKYQIALYPQMRQSLMPLKETEQDLPMSVELGFRVRYMIQ